ncbi:hypothetical protein NB697_001560 [Xanthomonas sacchari]|uniref:hypothetical protein n=1 Tax=Xanthomonas sacchari TaxID=56458 RepID=UPI00224EF1CB|nr:hypothetical protein [Xanthomonas sacchari]MCW0378714.1 hypothetical protein [Xanthomonas sacchari]
MTQLVPQTIFPDLQDRADELLKSGRCTEFDVKRLSADADKLSRIDAVGALEIKAMASILCNDFAGADDLYTRALRASGVSEEVVVRYLHLLGFSGQTLKVMSVFKEWAANEALFSPPSRAHIAQVLGYCGWLRDSERIRNELTSKGQSIGDTMIEFEYPAESVGEPEATEMAVLANQYFVSAPSVLQSSGVDPADLANLVGEVHSFLRSHGSPAGAVRSVSSPREDGTSSLMVSFVVTAEAEDASDLEWSLYGHLAEKEMPLLSSGVVTVGVISGCQ